VQPDALANISIAKKALADARDITDVLQIRDAAVAAHAYATARGADEVAQAAIEIKLRSERKAGECIIELKENGTIKQGGDQKSKRHRVALIDLGIKNVESKRWQRIASIPEEHFEEYLTTARKKTQSALLKEAKKIRRSKHQKITVSFLRTIMKSSQLLKASFSTYVRNSRKTQSIISLLIRHMEKITYRFMRT